MLHDQSTFTGHFHPIAKSDLSPSGRLLSVWKNVDGGSFYRDLTDLSFLKTNLESQSKVDDADEISEIMTKMAREKARLEQPRFPF